MINYGDETGEGTSGTMEYHSDLLAVRNFVCISSLFRRSLFRKEVWNTVGGHRTDLVWGYEDRDFWLACAAAGLVMKRVPEVFFYRVRCGSRSTEAREHRGELMRLLIHHHSEFMAPRRHVLGLAKHLDHRIGRKASRIVASILAQRHAM